MDARFLKSGRMVTGKAAELFVGLGLAEWDETEDDLLEDEEQDAIQDNEQEVEQAATVKPAKKIAERKPNKKSVPAKHRGRPKVKK